MAISDGKYIAIYGQRSFSQVGYGRPNLFSLTVSKEDKAQSVSIDFSLLSGALLGKIRTDVQNSVVEQIEFTVDENGCADFLIRLTHEPVFKILPNSIITFSVGNSPFNWYTGILNYPENQGSSLEPLVYRGFGLRKFLEDLAANTVYFAGTDLSDVVDDIVQNFIAPYCPIKYLPAKIDNPSGVVLAFDIELGKYSIRQIMDTLILMAQTAGTYFIWGVDGEGDFYFTKKFDEAIEKTFFVGYGVQDFNPKENFQDIRNVITVTRQQGAAQGGAGWKVGGVYNNESSKAKYGRQELTYQVPGFFSNNDVDLVGNALIGQLAEPTTSASVSGMSVRNVDDYILPGIYRFILPKRAEGFDEVVNDLDDFNEFTVFGTGDLVLSNDLNIFMWANGGVKFNFQNAQNQVATLNILAKGFVKTIKFFLRTDTPGLCLRVGVGVMLWDENTTSISINQQGVFIPIEWDVSGLSLKEINTFGIEITEDFLQPVNFWVDRLEVTLAGHQTYKIKFKRAKYTFAPTKTDIQCEFGGVPPSLVEYVAGLQKAASELKFTSEVL